MGRTKEEFMEGRPEADEREQCAHSAPVLASLEAWQERQLRTRIIAELHAAAHVDASYSATAGKIIEALREPLDPE